MGVTRGGKYFTWNEALTLTASPDILIEQREAQ